MTAKRISGKVNANYGIKIVGTPIVFMESYEAF